jgi:hypothetical protein
MRQYHSAIVALSLFLAAPTIASQSSPQPATEPIKEPTKEPTKVAVGKNPAVAALGKGHLAVVFEAPESDKPYKEIFFVSSKDNGKSWSNPVDISKTAGDSSHPAIAIEKSGAFDVVWTDTAPGANSEDIFFARSVDDGVTWSESKDISNTPGVSSEPSLAVSAEGKLNVVWTDTSKGTNNQDIYYSYSNNSGKTWGKDELLPAEDISNSAGKSSQPKIAIDEKGVCYAAWVDTSNTAHGPEIYFADNGAGQWSKPVNLSDSPGTSSHPDIACGAKGRIYVTWSDNSQKKDTADIWCVMAKQSGHFGKPINISNSSGLSTEPEAAACGNQLAIVWSDTTKSADSTPDIWGRITNTYGATFTTPVDLSNSPGFSKSPDVAIAGTSMYTVWEEVMGTSSTIKILPTELRKIVSGFADPVDLKQLHK